MTVSNDELKQVITDFIEMGHVENIVAMFKADTSLYAMTGDLLRDERFMVRLGIAVLFEELKGVRPGEVHFAVESLLPLLGDQNPILRGEAANLLGIIGTPEARGHLAALADDPNPQVSEIVKDIVEGWAKPSR